MKTDNDVDCSKDKMLIDKIDMESFPTATYNCESPKNRKTEASNHETSDHKLEHEK